MQDREIIYHESRWLSPIFIIFSLFCFYLGSGLIGLWPAEFSSSVNFTGGLVVLLIGLAMIYGGLDMIFKKIVVDKEKITVRRIFNSKTVFWQQIKEFKFVLTGATINGRPENQWHVLFTTFEPLKYLNFAELSDVGRLIFSPIERSFASHPGVPEFLAIVDRYQDFIKQNTSNCYLLDSFTKLAPAHVLLQALVSYHPQSCLIENQPLDLRSNILMN